MLRLLTLALIVGHSPLVQAQESTLCQGDECFFFDGQLGSAFGQQDEDSQFQYRVGAGYRFSDHWELGLAMSDIDHNGEDSSWAVESYVRGLYPLTQEDSLYMDIGGRNAGDALLLGAGIQSAFTEHLVVDVGYRYYSEPNSAVQGDVYTFGVGIRYYFSPTVSEPVTQSVISEALLPDPVKKETVTIITPPVVKLTQEEQCTVKITDPDSVSQVKSYRVKPGDWGFKIAKAHCTTYRVLIHLNPWLKEAKYIYPDDNILIPLPQH